MVDARVRTDRRWTPGAAAVSIDKSIMTSVKFTHDTTNKPNIQHGNNQPPVHRIFAHPCQPKAQGQRSPKAPHANRPFSSHHSLPFLGTASRAPLRDSDRPALVLMLHAPLRPSPLPCCCCCCCCAPVQGWGGEGAVVSARMLLLLRWTRLLPMRRPPSPPSPRGPSTYRTP